MVSKRKKFFYKWRRLNLVFRVLLILVAVVSIIIIAYIQQSKKGYFDQSGVVLFSVLNFNVIALCALAFVVGRNIIKLFFDRKKGLLGSGLKLKLVSAFVGLTLVPIIILFIVASGILSKLMNDIVTGKSARISKSAYYVANEHTSLLKSNLKLATLAIKNKILLDPLVYSNDDLLKELFINSIRSYALNEIFLYRVSDYQLLHAIYSGSSQKLKSEFPTETRLKSVNQDSDLKVFLEFNKVKNVRAYHFIVFRGESYVLVSSSAISDKLAESLKIIFSKSLEQEQIKLFQSSLKSGYLVSLGFITLLLIFAAVWIAFYIAKDLSGPIASLLEATRAVARGRYGYKIKVLGNDELSQLTIAFNKMTEDLQKTRNASELRRRFIETIQSQLAVGVIGVAKDYSIVSINNNALSLISKSEDHEILGTKLFEHFNEDFQDKLLTLINKLVTKNESNKLENQLRTEQIFTMHINSEERRVLCTVGELKTDTTATEGYLLLFDDVTDLVKAQEVVAWREVARRIAHEIKNPLTPLQLSVQRLKRALPKKSENNLHVLTETILTHINSIKRLADEFSRFARMPVASFDMCDLNNLIADILAEFSERNRDIVYKFFPDTQIKKIFVDSEQMRRVFFNLIDNSAQAFLNSPNKNQRVTLRTIKVADKIIVELTDNGPGIKSSDAAKIFEPYFTKSPGGTGLGLSIVSTIIADHNGTINLDSSYEEGAKFIIELPLTYKEETIRRMHS